MAPADPFCDSLYLSTSLSPPSSAASSAMSHNRPPPCPSEACSALFSDGRGKHYEELWQACAGPLVSLPKLKQLVMYLPQGHIEQISASTNQKTECSELPKHDLSPHVLCRVVDVQLSAESDTDEVKALLSLLPEPEGTDPHSTVDEELEPITTSNQTVHMFCKTLTASDTSTHGGFSVPRKHACCLPPLDMTRCPPTQELEATDLHDVRWRFRHTYRGQPKRHLLTTGWSAFVSQKRLIAGDAVIFLRGKNGEFRVGVRRAPRHQSTPPPTVLPSQSLQMGVIATASHAILTRTMFCVYYTPRISPAEFVIPLDRFKASLSVDIGVGTRFQMRFETEDATERRFNGTITGIEDYDPIRWPASKWRSLKVGWYEHTIHERHERVSPWEIELCVNQAAPPAPPGPRCKRVRANVGSHPSPVTEHSLVSTGRSKEGFGPLLSANITTVLQGQEPRALASPKGAYHGGQQPFPHSGYLPQSQHMRLQPSPLSSLPRSFSGDKQCSGNLFWGILGQNCQRNYPYETFRPSQSPSKQQLFSDAPNFSSSFSLSMFSHPYSSAHTPIGLPVQQADAGTSGPWSKTPNSHPSSLQYPGGINDPSAACLTGSRNGLRVGSSSASDLGLQETGIAAPLQMIQGRTLPLCRPNTLYQKSPWELEAETLLPLPSPITGSEEVHSGCKVFGVILKDQPPSIPEPTSDTRALAEKPKVEDVNNALLSNLVDHAMDSSTTSSEMLTSNSDVVREGQCKAQVAVRSCTKVVKKGSVVGRGVDLSKLSGYNQLFDELERMFDLEGQLRDKEQGWQVAYSDNENDMLEVGDDPWSEFCTMARKIHILSREEVAQVNDSTHQSGFDLCSSRNL